VIKGRADKGRVEDSVRMKTSFRVRRGSSRVPGRRTYIAR
jgi:hypothetical protein